MEEAQRLILERARPLAAEPVRLEEAAGRVLAEAARATVDLPPFPSSAMDGFAVRSEDTPGKLHIVARIAAGVPAPRALARGEAMSISTGGVVPDGADAVIPIEYVVESDNDVEISDRVEPGASVRARGGDLREGDVVVEAGTRLDPAALGALAAAGVAAIVCSARPRASVLATGTELRPPGEPLGPARFTRRTGLSSRPSSRPRARRSRDCRSWRTTRRRTAQLWS